MAKALNMRNSFFVTGIVVTGMLTGALLICADAIVAAPNPGPFAPETLMRAQAEVNQGGGGFYISHEAAPVLTVPIEIRLLAGSRQPYPDHLEVNWKYLCEHREWTEAQLRKAGCE